MRVERIKDWLEEGKKAEITIGGKSYQGTISCIEQDYLVLKERGERGEREIYISTDKIEALSFPK